MSLPPHLELPPDLDAAVEAIVRSEGISPQDLFRDAIREYVKVHQFRALRDQMIRRVGDPIPESRIGDEVS